MRKHAAAALLCLLSLLFAVEGGATTHETFRAYVLSHATLGGVPFDAGLFTDVVRKELATSRPLHQRNYAEVEFLIEETAYRATLEGFDLDVVLAIGWQESKWRPWVISNGGNGEYCGPFQQAARYSMDPPLPSRRNGGASCQRDARCRTECARLRFDPWYAVDRLMAYLRLVDRVTGGQHRAQVCRYQGGARGACGEAAQSYAQRHVAYREQLIVLYRKHAINQILTNACARVLANYSLAYWRPI